MYINMEKYESKNDMLNKVATERAMIFTRARKSENLSWGRSDLKLGELKFLDCKHVHRSTDLQARLSKQVFVHNNTLGPGIGYTPHQLVLGMRSGVPGIYEVPESDSSKFARSLK